MKKIVIPANSSTLIGPIIFKTNISGNH